MVYMLYILSSTLKYLFLQCMKITSMIPEEACCFTPTKMLLYPLCDFDQGCHCCNKHRVLLALLCDTYCFYNMLSYHEKVL